MNDDLVLEPLDLEIAIEPERYELRARPAYYFEVDRREFFKFMGAGILVVCTLKGVHAQESGSGKRRSGEELLTILGAGCIWGKRQRYCLYGEGRSRANIRTSLSQAVARNYWSEWTKSKWSWGTHNLSLQYRGRSAVGPRQP